MGYDNEVPKYSIEIEIHKFVEGEKSLMAKHRYMVHRENDVIYQTTKNAAFLIAEELGKLKLR